jgi:TetR/AcrR family transcriptional repressor of uid operon
MPKLDEDTQRARREQILDAAQHCFARHGFHSTTIQDICREARISAGAFYLYFKSKEELIEGICEREKKNFAAALASVAEAPDFLAALMRLGEAYCVEEPVEKLRMQVEINAEALRNPAVGRTVAEIDRFVLDSFTSLLLDAEAKGRISPQGGAATIALVISMLGDGLYLRRALDPTFDVKACMPIIQSVISFLIRPADSGTEHDTETFQPVKTGTGPYYG